MLLRRGLLFNCQSNYQSHCHFESNQLFRVVIPNTKHIVIMHEPAPDGIAPQRVDSTSPLPHDNTMRVHATLIEPCSTTDTAIPQNTQRNPLHLTEFQRLKQKWVPLERVEGVALMTNWHPGDTVPSDQHWTVMGKEWLRKLERAKMGAKIFCGIRTKGKGLEKFTMRTLAHTEPTGTHMWQLTHCGGSFDLLVRKADPGRKKRKM